MFERPQAISRRVVSSFTTNTVSYNIELTPQQNFLFLTGGKHGLAKALS